MLEHIIKMKSEVIFHTFFRMELYVKRNVRTYRDIIMYVY